MDNVFELATRKKLRFATVRGLISTEDLWDLTLEELDKIARSTNKELKESSEESFITAKTVANAGLVVRLELLKSIINTKMEDAAKSKAAAERRAKRTQILEIMESKQSDAMSRKSLKQLQAELEALEE